MSLTLGMRRQQILQRIPKDRHAEAFGTYCMSRPANTAKHDNPAHLLNMWARSNNRGALLSSCAALLCWDASGSLMLLSAPRLCVDAGSSLDELYIVAQRGNAVGRNTIVSIPIRVLDQSVVGFAPETVDPVMETIEMDVNECCYGGELPAGTKGMAKLPLLVPLGFGHGIDEDLSSGLIRLKLASSHPYYSAWIQSTSWLCQNLKGRSLQLNGNSNDSHSIPQSLHVSHATHQDGSLAWDELCQDLERIRHQNLERFLDCNREYYEEDGTSSPLPELQPELAACRYKEDATKESLGWSGDTVTRVPTAASEENPEENIPRKQPAAQEFVDSTLSSKFPALEVRASCNAVSPLGGRSSVDNDKVPSPPRLITEGDSSAVLPSYHGEAGQTLSVLANTTLENERDPQGAQPRETSTARLGNSGSGNVDLPPYATNMNLPSWDNTAVMNPKLDSTEQPITVATLPQLKQKKRPATDTIAAVRKKQKSWGAVEDKILRALNDLLAVQMEQPSKLLVALFAEYVNPGSASFKKALKNLQEEGLVRLLRGGAVAVTILGKTYLPLVAPLTSDAALHNKLLVMLQKKKGMNKLKLKALWDALGDGDTHGIKSVASAMGYTNVQSQGFKDAVAAMRNLDFVIHDTKRKTLKLADSLFPFKNNQLMGANAALARGEEELSDEDWAMKVVSI